MKRDLSRALWAGAATLLLGLPAQAHDVVKVQLRACPTGTAVGEVGSCGKIWKLGAGDASLDSAGNFKAMVKGLVLNDPTTAEFNGTADGVAHVVGAVLCAGTVAGQTEWVPLTKSGDATIKAKLNLPATCIAPTLLVREVWDGKVGGWLAGPGY
ncbi:MAG: hypothetical protein K2X67_03605 [Burkholderiales bacterium]|jgi:hypothetical protein|nr:hypothetical protein [Burkholderiales bacterium]